MKVLFFARLREQLGTSELDFTDAGATTTALLRQLLADQNDSHWQKCLFAENIIVAVNQQVAGWDHPLQPGDEVAFFPPVTGG